MTKKGISIGIEYQNTKVSSLKGTVNDSLNVGKLLNSKYGYNITYLNDKFYPKSHTNYPSKKNIEYWITKLLQEARDGDELFIGYAGHGTQLQYDPSNSEEIEFKDEAIIPADYDFTDKSAIIDDEIQGLLATYLNKKPNCKVFMLFDCCHSGTIADLRYQFNYDNLQKNYAFYDNNHPNSFSAKVILISGCRDTEVSWGDLINLTGSGQKTQQGVMTSAFINVISRTPSSLADVFEIVKGMYMYTSSYKQQPQITCNYDISKDSNSALRSIIVYDSFNSIINASKSIPIKTVIGSSKSKIVAKHVNIKPSVKDTVNLYLPNNRDRYRYKYLNGIGNNNNTNRNRYNYNYANRNKDNVVDISNKSIDIKYGIYGSDTPYRNENMTGIVQMNDLLGMVV